MKEYLEFDHLQFKLMIIQKLMYELHLFNEEYHLGKQYIELLNSHKINDVDKSLKSHVEAAIDYFEKLKIPVYMADMVYDLYVHEGNEIYFEINPLWKKKEEYKNGKEFSIVSISKKELKQFGKLRKISFRCFNDGGQKLVRFLEKEGIEVLDYQTQYNQDKSLIEKIKYKNHQTITTNEKKINPIITFIIFALFVGGYTYLNTRNLNIQRDIEIKETVIQSKENATSEVIDNKVVIRHNEVYDEYWIEDMQGKDITNQTFYKVTEADVENKLLLRGENGYAFFDIDTYKISEYYEAVEKKNAYKTKDNTEKVYLVTKDNENWYVLSSDKIYDKPAIINKGTIMKTLDKYQFMVCYVDLTNTDQPVVRTYAEKVGGQ
ncbi:MAG: hypothetical protein RR585_06620 [Coprobacillus sp.]